jgi:hypothetical protein
VLAWPPVMKNAENAVPGVVLLAAVLASLTAGCEARGRVVVRDRPEVVRERVVVAPPPVVQERVIVRP